MHRHIHYEAAFEDYLRSRGIPYVPVDETRKAIFSGTRIKSFDFLIYPPESKPWIVDVKGRCVHVFRRANGGEYTDRSVAKIGELLSPLEPCENPLDIRDLFGDLA